MSKGQKLFPAGIPAVPHTQGGGGLVREHHVVLRLVEHRLCLVLLQEGTGVKSISYEDVGSIGRITSLGS